MERTLDSTLGKVRSHGRLSVEERTDWTFFLESHQLLCLE